MSAQKRPEWAGRVITALERAGLSEADLPEIVGASRAKILRWLADGNSPYFSRRDALAKVSKATGATCDWILAGKEFDPLRDKASIARIVERTCNRPVVDIEMARAVMRRDVREAQA